EIGLQIKGTRINDHVNCINGSLLEPLIKFITEELDPKISLRVMVNFMVHEDPGIRKLAFSYIRGTRAWDIDGSGEYAREALAGFILKDTRITGMLTQETYDNDIYSPDTASGIAEFMGSSPVLGTSPDKIRVLAGFTEADPATAVYAIEKLGMYGSPAQVAMFLMSAADKVQMKAVQVLDAEFAHEGRLAICDAILDSSRPVKTTEYTIVDYLFIKRAFCHNGPGDYIVEFLGRVDLRKNPKVLDTFMMLGRIQGDNSIGYNQLVPILDILTAQRLPEAISYYSYNEDAWVLEEVLKRLKIFGSTGKDLLVDRILELSKITFWRYDKDTKKPTASTMTKHPHRYKSFEKNMREGIPHELISFIVSAGIHRAEDIKALGLINTGNIEAINISVGQIVNRLLKILPQDVLIEGLDQLASHKVSAKMPQYHENDGITDTISYFMLADDTAIRDLAFSYMTERIHADADHYFIAKRIFLRRLTEDAQRAGYSSAAFADLITRHGMEVLGVMNRAVKEADYNRIDYADYKMLILCRDKSGSAAVRKEAARILGVLASEDPVHNVRSTIKSAAHMKDHTEEDNTVLEYFMAFPERRISFAAWEVLQENRHMDLLESKDPVERDEAFASLINTIRSGKDAEYFFKEKLMKVLVESSVSSDLYKQAVSDYGSDILDIIRNTMESVIEKNTSYIGLKDREKSENWKPITFEDYIILIRLTGSGPQDLLARAQKLLKDLLDKQPVDRLNNMYQSNRYMFPRFDGHDEVIEMFKGMGLEGLYQKMQMEEVDEEIIDSKIRMPFKPAITAAGIGSVFFTASSASAGILEMLDEIGSFMVPKVFEDSLALSVIVTAVIAAFLSAIISRRVFTGYLGRILDNRLNYTAKKIYSNISDIFGEPRRNGDESYTYIKKMSLDSDSADLVKAFLDEWKKDDKTADGKITILKKLIIGNDDEFRFHKLLAVYLYNNNADTDEDIRKMLRRSGIINSNTVWHALVRYTLLAKRRENYSYLNRSWVIMKLLKVWKPDGEDKADLAVLRPLLDHPSQLVRKTVIRQAGYIKGDRIQNRPLWHWPAAVMLSVMLLVSIAFNVMSAATLMDQHKKRQSIADSSFAGFMNGQDVGFKDKRLEKRIKQVFSAGWRNIPYKELEDAVRVLADSKEDAALQILEVLLGKVNKMTGDRRELAALVAEAIGTYGNRSLVVLRDYVSAGDNLGDEENPYIYKEIIDIAYSIFSNNYYDTPGTDPLEGQVKKIIKNSFAEDALEIMVRSMDHKNDEVSDHAFSKILEIDKYYDIRSMFAGILAENERNINLIMKIAFKLASDGTPESSPLQAGILRVTKKSRKLHEKIFSVYFDSYRQAKTDSERTRRIEMLAELLSGISPDGIRGEIDNVNCINLAASYWVYEHLIRLGLPADIQVRLRSSFLMHTDKQLRKDPLDYLMKCGDAGRLQIARVIKEGVNSKYFYTNQHEEGARPNREYDNEMTMNIVKFLGGYRGIEDKSEIYGVLARFKYAHKEAAVAAVKFVAGAGNTDYIIPFMGALYYEVIEAAFEELKTHGSAGRDALADAMIDDSINERVHYWTVQELTGTHSLIRMLVNYTDLGVDIMKFLVDTDLTENENARQAAAAVAGFKEYFEAEVAEVLLEAFASKSMFKEMVPFLSSP
ncbi:hypothetical protein ACFLTD_04475, partial [Elusimicrobiota bacterium]